MPYGPCDDDVEVTCPYVGMLPDESDCEDGSPLNFDHSITNRIGYDEEPELFEDFFDD